MLRHSKPTLVLVLAFAVAGCEGARNNSSWSTAEDGAPIVPALTKENPKENVAAGGASDRGVGPVDHVDIASLDAARALSGSQLFATKCSACHKIEERYIGPALAGVTRRRQPEWILNMMLNPENMIQQDPTARALLAEYIAPMANQHLTRNEAESILAYFIQQDAGEAAPADTEPGADGQPVTRQ